jgi:hypothetical protein
MLSTLILQSILAFARSRGPTMLLGAGHLAKSFAGRMRQRLLRALPAGSALCQRARAKNSGFGGLATPTSEAERAWAATRDTTNLAVLEAL